MIYSKLISTFLFCTAPIVNKFANRDASIVRLIILSRDFFFYYKLNGEFSPSETVKQLQFILKYTRAHLVADIQNIKNSMIKYQTVPIHQNQTVLTGLCNRYNMYRSKYHTSQRCEYGYRFNYIILYVICWLRSSVLIAAAVPIQRPPSRR